MRQKERIVIDASTKQKEEKDKTNETNETNKADELDATQKADEEMMQFVIDTNLNQ